MKKLIYSLFPLLSACANTQMTVVDGLTTAAKNDGVLMTPSRWVVSEHPLQTTYVSLNGQLALRAGQVCIASRYRSPYSSDCFTDESLNTLSPDELDQLVEQKAASTQTLASLKSSGVDASLIEAQAASLQEIQSRLVHQSVARSGKIYREYYAPVDESLGTLTTALQNEKSKALLYANQVVSALVCETAAMKAGSSEDSCTEAQTAKTTAYQALEEARSTVRSLLNQPNRLVYNWSQNYNLKNGVVVSEENSANVAAEKHSAGYTIVSGLVIERYQSTCSELERLKKRPDYKRLKMVTTTLSAEHLYYHANEDKSMSLQSQLSLSPAQLQNLKASLTSEQKISLDSALSASSSISSQGYFNKPDISLIPLKSMDYGVEGGRSASGVKSGLTYYAVLSDVGTLACE